MTNKNDNLEHFLESLSRLKQAKLREDVRSEMFSEIISKAQQQKRAANTPLRAGFLVRVREALSVDTHAFAYSFTAVVLIFGVSAGTIFASERSLPGDALYPVKVSVAEPIRGIFVREPEERAEREAQLASRRLSEVETLALNGRLDDEARAEAMEQFEKHVERFETASGPADTEASLPLAAHLRLEAELNAHARILGRIGTYVDEDGREKLEPVLARVSAKAEEAGNERKEAEQRFIASVPDDGEKHPEVAQALDTKRTAIRTLIDTVGTSLKRSASTTEANERKMEALSRIQQDVLNDVTAVLNDAHQDLENAEAKIREGNLKEAFGLLFASERAAEEASISLQQAHTAFLGTNIRFGQGSGEESSGGNAVSTSTSATSTDPLDGTSGTSTATSTPSEDGDDTSTSSPSDPPGNAATGTSPQQNGSGTSTEHGTGTPADPDTSGAPLNGTGTPINGVLENIL